jgi:anamorsin
VNFYRIHMSPTAVYTEESSIQPPTRATGAALAIGSLSTAEDGQYQALISELGQTRRVDKQLLDRIVDEGMSEYLYSV